MLTGDQQAQPVAPSCPRCASANTKFCYYNNYSLTQPRYFCKACRRYWTKGGSLRNVPVGGGCRKSRRSRSRAHASSSRGSADHHSGGADSNTDSSTSSSGAEIDMAAVFARYVSQPVPEARCEAQPNCDDLESFDFEMLLADDVFWSSTASEDGSSLTGWEPMAALQQLDSVPIIEDQFGTHSDNLLVDNTWSCIDLSGYGDFYTP